MLFTANYFYSTETILLAFPFFLSPSLFTMVFNVIFSNRSHLYLIRVRRVRGVQNEEGLNRKMKNRGLFYFSFCSLLTYHFYVFPTHPPTHPPFLFLYVNLWWIKMFEPFFLNNTNASPHLFLLPTLTHSTHTFLFPFAFSRLFFLFTLVILTRIYLIDALKVDFD